ncbi:MAG: HipA domain-containing protein [Acidithiobacillus sp.]
MEERTRRLVRLLQGGSQTGQDICRQMGVSRPTLSRLMDDCREAYPGFLCQIGSARSTRYAWAASVVDHPNRPWAIPVYEVIPSGHVRTFGVLTVLHADEYLFAPENAEMAQRFPRGWIRAHYEGIPWFLQDVRPQGYLGRALAQRLFLDRGDVGASVSIQGFPEHVHQWNDAQVLQVISRAGDDLPGCFVVGEASAARVVQGREARETKDILVEDRPNVYALRVREMMSGQWVPHSSAGGEQPKFTACVRDVAARRTDENGSLRQVLVKFSPPPSSDEDRVSRRWRDLLVAEFHALSVLARYGVPAVVPDLLRGSDGRWFLESPRFDRSGPSGRTPAFSLRTLTLEAVGDLPAWVTSAERLHGQGVIDAHSKEQIFLLDAYDHFIGNTDRHPGNLSFAQTEQSDFGKFTLAPAYDMLPMQYAPDTQGSMVPNFRAIPPYAAQHDQVDMALDMAFVFWSTVAGDVRVSEEFREMAMVHAETLAKRLRVNMGYALPSGAATLSRNTAQHLERAFHNGALPQPGEGMITGTVRTLAKDANANVFALMDGEDGAVAVPIPDADRDRLSIGEIATFQAVAGSRHCAIVALPPIPSGTGPVCPFEKKKNGDAEPG